MSATEEAPRRSPACPRSASTADQDADLHLDRGGRSGDGAHPAACCSVLQRCCSVLQHLCNTKGGAPAPGGRGNGVPLSNTLRNCRPSGDRWRSIATLAMLAACQGRPLGTPGCASRRPVGTRSGIGTQPDEKRTLVFQQEASALLGRAEAVCQECAEGCRIAMSPKRACAASDVACLAVRRLGCTVPGNRQVPVRPPSRQRPTHCGGAQTFTEEIEAELEKERARPTMWKGVR